MTSYPVQALTYQDEKWMREAIKLAQTARLQGEVPVGALVVLDNRIIGEGYNCPIAQHDPTAHAEIIALQKSALYLKNYRLINCTLYVTLEPCLMCAGALTHARIKRLVYGAPDIKRGAIQSQMRALDAPFLNHHVHYEGGILAAECQHLLSHFFQIRRKEKSCVDKELKLL